jgi:hypothetical protein
MPQSAPCLVPCLQRSATCSRYLLCCTTNGTHLNTAVKKPIQVMKSKCDVKYATIQIQSNPMVATRVQQAYLSRDARELITTARVLQSSVPLLSFKAVYHCCPSKQCTTVVLQNTTLFATLLSPSRLVNTCMRSTVGEVSHACMRSCASGGRVTLLFYLLTCMLRYSAASIYMHGAQLKATARESTECN